MGFRQRSCLRQGDAHGEDLRRQDLVSLRHPELDGLGWLRGTGPGARGCRTSSSWRYRAVRATVPRPHKGLRCGLRRLGYELHVGGNGGIKVRVTDLLTKVETEGGPQYCGAFTQLYREEAHYLGTHSTLGRARRSPITSSSRSLEDEGEPQGPPWAFFLFGQKFAQIDPWKARAEGAQAHEFTLLKIL